MSSELVLRDQNYNSELDLRDQTYKSELDLMDRNYSSELDLRDPPMERLPEKNIKKNILQSLVVYFLSVDDMVLS